MGKKSLGFRVLATLVVLTVALAMWIVVIPSIQAAAAWISPTGYSGGSGWNSKSNAYDDDTGTYASVAIMGTGWSSFLELTHAGVDASKIRYYAKDHYGGDSIDEIDVDVYYSSSWHNVYEGDFTNDTWEEKNLASTYNVTKSRVRFHSSSAGRGIARLKEFDFYGEVHDYSPDAPTSLLAEGAANPGDVTDTTPEFSAIGTDPNDGDTITHAYVQVDDAGGFSSPEWDSGWLDIADFTEGDRCGDIIYNGSALAEGTLYFWRIKFKDDGGNVGSWSTNDNNFTMSGPPNAPTSLLCEGAMNPTGVTDTAPEFSAVGTDPNDGDTLTHAEVEVGTTAGGNDMWDSGWQDIADFTEGNRCPDINYAGSTLSPATTYYWRIRFKDNDGGEGAWSSNAQFTTKEAFYIDPASRSVTASSTYTFDVKAAHQTSFDSYDFIVGFDPDVATVGDLADAGWLNSASDSGESIDNDGGVAKYGAYSTGTDVSGSGTLATFTVTAQATGTFTPGLLAASVSMGTTANDLVWCDDDFPWDNSDASGGDSYADCDGVVNAADMNRVAARWNYDCTGGTYPNCTGCDAEYDIHADYTGDCDITVVDIMQVVAKWGETSPEFDLHVSDLVETTGGGDDTEQAGMSAANDYDNTTVTVGGATPYFAGWIFRNVPLDYGDVVTAAYLVLDVASKTGDVTLELFTEDQVNHEFYGDNVVQDFSNDKISQRIVDKYPGTGGYCDSVSRAAYDYCGLWVEWTIDSTGVVTSPNLALIIQEAVGRADWHNSDFITILARPAPTETHSAVINAFEHATADPAKLGLGYVENTWSGWDGDLGPADDRLPIGGTVAHTDIYTHYNNMWDDMQMQPGFDSQGWRDTLSASEKADAINLSWSTTFTVGQITLGSPLGYNNADPYYYAQQQVDNNPDADIFHISPDNEEDNYVEYAPTCTTTVGASFAGWAADDDCDNDTIPDSLEFVFATAKAYIGVKSKRPSAGAAGLFLAYDSYIATADAKGDPGYLKKVMDYGVGSFFDIGNYHYYPGISCWDGVDDKLNGTTSDKGGDFCNNVPPGDTLEEDHWGFVKALENANHGYSTGYEGYSGDRAKYIGSNEFGKTATPNNSTEEDTQAEYVYKHYAEALGSVDESLLAYAIWFSWFDHRITDYDGKSYGLVLCELDAGDNPVLPCLADDSFGNGMEKRPAYHSALAFSYNLSTTVTVSEMTTGATPGSYDLPTGYEGYLFSTGTITRVVVWNNDNESDDLEIDCTSYVRIARSTAITEAEMSGVGADHDGIGWAKCYDGSNCYDERGSGSGNSIWTPNWNDQGVSGKYEIAWEELDEPIMIWSDDGDIDITWGS